MRTALRERACVVKGVVHRARQSNAYAWWKITCNGTSVHDSRLLDDQVPTCLWCAASKGIDLDDFVGFAP